MRLALLVIGLITSGVVPSDEVASQGDLPYDDDPGHLWNRLHATLFRAHGYARKPLLLKINKA